MAVPITQWVGTTPRQLRIAIRNDRSRNLRRGVAAVSLLGIATMAAATTLLQMGVFKRLPDPPVGNFALRRKRRL